MNSVQLILESLKKNKNDKKAQLDLAFDESSQWLKNQLDVIRGLIKNDPREELNSVSTESMKEENPKKRKSPESSSEFKLSPEQKRNSIDMEELLVSSGFANINSLKKEQLLDELEKRGVIMKKKELKQTLIDALKNQLLLEKRQALQSALNPSTFADNDFLPSKENLTSNELTNLEKDENIAMQIPEEEEIEEMVNHDDISTNESICSSSNPHQSEEPHLTQSQDTNKPVKARGSLLQEIRLIVNNNFTHKQEEHEDSSMRIKTEYEHRKSRHRDSQISKSLNLTSSGNLSDFNSSEDSEKQEVHEDAKALIESAAIDINNNNTDDTTHEIDLNQHVSPMSAKVMEMEFNNAPGTAEENVEIQQVSEDSMSAENSKDEISRDSNVSQNENIWMEVSSPMKNNSNEKHDMKENTTSEHLVSNVEEKDISVLSHVSPVIEASTPVVKEVLPHISQDQPLAPSVGISVPVVVDVAKKLPPSNLLANKGQSSFLQDKSAPSKPTIVRYF